MTSLKIVSNFQLVLFRQLHSDWWVFLLCFLFSTFLCQCFCISDNLGYSPDELFAHNLSFCLKDLDGKFADWHDDVKPYSSSSVEKNYPRDDQTFIVCESQLLKLLHYCMPHGAKLTNLRKIQNREKFNWYCNSAVKKVNWSWREVSSPVIYVNCKKAELFEGIFFWGVS